MDYGRIVNIREIDSLSSNPFLSKIGIFISLVIPGEGKNALILSS